MEHIYLKRVTSLYAEPFSSYVIVSSLN